MSAKSRKARIRESLTFLLAAFLTFAGPTYIILAFQEAEIPYVIRTLLGIALFLVGLALVFRLVKRGKLR